MHCFKTALINTCLISPTANTTIKFKDGVEFTVVPQLVSSGTYLFHVQDIKGDFEMTKIRSQGSGTDVPYNTENKTFLVGNSYIGYNHEFHILTDVEFKKVSYVNVSYKLEIASTRMKLLKLFEYYEDEIVLPEHEYLKFRCLIKKIRENMVEVVIENPWKNVEIQGKADNFKQESNINHNFDMTLSFVFDPTTLDEFDEPSNNVISNKMNSLSLKHQAKIQKKQKTQKFESNFYEIMSTKSEYSDVILISSEGNKIPSYRSVLAFYSEIFKSVFDKIKEIPVKIHIEGFEAKIISAALGFCYGKTEAIEGNESKLFEFATKYDIIELKEACCTFLEANVNPKNVCEYIQIAYSNHFDDLKQKCHQVLKKNKSEVDPTKFKELPKEILVDVFYV